MAVAFGDFEPDDAWGTEDYDPIAVGRFYVEILHGFDASPLTWEDLEDWQRGGIVAAVISTLSMRLAEPTATSTRLAKTFWMAYAAHNPGPVPIPADLDDLSDAALRLWIIAVIVAMVTWVERQGAL